MRTILIIVFAAWAFAACTTKETKETHTETVVHDDQPAANTNDNNPNVEMNVSDSGAGVKIKVP